MTICFLEGHPTIFCPTGDDTDVILGSFASPSGAFQVTCTETILTLFCLSTPTISVIGSLDVCDILAAAGPQYADTEGTFMEVVWNAEETLLFISTMDGLLGISEIVPRVMAEVYDDDSDVNSIIIPGEFVPFRLELRSVLIFPMKDFLLVASVEKLFVISKETRLVLLVDWKNYTHRAKRYLLPSVEAVSDTSSCILTVLPRTTPIDDSKLATESVFVKSALICTDSEFGETMYILYIDGSIRRFAVTVPVAPMHSVLACDLATTIASCGDSLAVATKLGICCFGAKKSWTVVLPGVTCLSWSQGFLAVAHSNGSLSVLNTFCGKVLLTSQSISCKSIVLSMRYYSLSFVHAGTIAFINLFISGTLFTKCLSLNNQIFCSRDSLRVIEFPREAMSFIPYPEQYCEENGPVEQFCVQINKSSLYVLVSGKAGFALFSRARKHCWEVLGNKSQERRVGQLDFFGFITESVFFTKSINSDEVSLWSVFKRIDLEFVLGTVPLSSPTVHACTTVTGKLILAFEDRIDILFLKTDNLQYSLELTQSVSTFFAAPIARLVFVNACILGIDSGGEVFTSLGDRVCGNVEQVFAADQLGSHHYKPDLDEERFFPLIDLEDEGSFYDDSFDTWEDSECVENFFIGDGTCQVCQKVPHVRTIGSRIAHSIHSGAPLVWMVETNGYVSIWVVLSSTCIRFVARFQGGGVAFWPQAGVFAALTPTTLKVTYTSAVHALLNVLPGEAALQICRTLSASVFFPAVLEMYLHTSLDAAMCVISKDAVCTSLVACEHEIPRMLTDRLLQAFKVAECFPSFFPSVFASAIRKSEPHILFPLAVRGLFTTRTIEEIYASCIDGKQFRDAALLMVVLQEQFGPEKVRAQFAKPLFDVALQNKEYLLASEIAHFYQPENVWGPNSVDGLVPSISTHFSNLLAASNSAEMPAAWLNVVCVAKVFGLELKEWIDALSPTVQAKAIYLSKLEYPNEFQPIVGHISLQLDCDHSTPDPSS